MDEKNSEFKQLLSKLESLEKRIGSIEEKIGMAVPVVQIEEGEGEPQKQKDTGKIIHEDVHSVFESNIGGYGLALIGNIVLLFGIIFLWQYLQKLDHPGLSFVFGYSAVAAMLAGAKFMHGKIARISFMFSLVGQLLLFFLTLHLHFLSATPVIQSKETGILLLYVVIGNQVYVSIKRKSELYGAVALLMAFVTGVVSDTTYFMLSSAVVIAAGAVWYYFLYGWKTTFIITIFLSFSIFIIWILKNPGLLDASNLRLHHICNIYLMSCAAAFSLITLFPKREIFTRNFIMSAVLVFGLNFSLVLVFFAFTFFANNYIILFVTISIFCILFSIILKEYSAWEFAPAFYAIYGFVTMSVSVYGIFGLPYVFLFLAIQSLLVLSMALWFRSWIIVALNAALLFSVLITYLVTSQSVNVINFSFAAVAFLTARVLNIEKQQLRLSTNYLRNGYLAVMFIMVLYSLQKALSDQYITLSWTIAAAVFFLFNLILSNAKYRLMALFAVIAAAIRLFLVDFSRISFVYRVIAFLFLAIISISISIYYYTKVKGKHESQ